MLEMVLPYTSCYAPCLASVRHALLGFVDVNTPFCYLFDVFCSGTVIPENQKGQLAWIHTCLMVYSFSCGAIN